MGLVVRKLPPDLGWLADCVGFSSLVEVRALTVGQQFSQLVRQRPDPEADRVAVGVANLVERVSIRDVGNERPIKLTPRFAEAHLSSSDSGTNS